MKNREDYLKKLKTFLGSWLTGAEIGCYKGDFSAQLLFMLKINRLYLVDSFQTGGKRYGKELNNIHSSYSNQDHYQCVSNRFNGNNGVKIIKGFSFDVVKNFLPNVFDFIYHDASHLYEDVKKDLADWLPKLKVNGLMCGHDYIDHTSFGVKQAVDEFCAEYNFQMIIYNENGGDYALKRK